MIGSNINYYTGHLLIPIFKVVSIQGLKLFARYDEQHAKVLDTLSCPSTYLRNIARRRRPRKRLVGTGLVSIEFKTTSSSRKGSGIALGCMAEKWNFILGCCT
jgi:hypothetical protein